jgi:hypothetical protein
VLVLHEHKEYFSSQFKEAQDTAIESMTEESELSLILQFLKRPMQLTTCYRYFFNIQFAQFEI